MLQTLTRLIYPPLCLGCEDPVDATGSLCPNCWKDTPFIHDPACTGCGVQLVGDGAEDSALLCDDCMQTPREWDQAASVFMYGGVARDLVLALKHADRHDLVAPFAGWAAPHVRRMGLRDPVCVPVPLHITRLLKRRFNQAAIIAADIARALDCPALPDALHRAKRTQSLDGKTRSERFETLAEAIHPNPKSVPDIRHKNVILVDDVMTTGATLTTCCAALRRMEPASISVLTLARVGK